MLRLFSICLSLCLLTACVTQNSSITNGKSYPGPTISKEEKASARKLADNATLVTEATLSEQDQIKLLEETYIALVKAGEEICSAVNAHHYGCDWFVFRLAESEDVNAYPWGVSGLTVSKGILPYIRNKHEMAYMLTHQFGHILTGHVDANGPTRIGPTTPLGAVIGYAFCGLGCVVSDPFKFGKRQRLEAHSEGWKTLFSPAQEREADYIAAYLMDAAGYDVEAGVKFLLNLVALEKKRGGAKLVYNIIHPFRSEQLAHIAATKREILDRRKTGDTLIPIAVDQRKRQ